jgi:hypothetical protein
MFIYIHILSYQTYITKYSFKACFDYNIVTKRISVFVVTAYGQNLILFCPVDNCCSKPVRWSIGPKSIILEVKIFSNDPKVKYHGTYNTDGHAVVIHNL